MPRSISKQSEESVESVRKKWSRDSKLTVNVARTQNAAQH